MKTMHRTFCAMLLPGLLLGFALPGARAGEAPRDPKENAALQYWLAFAVLPAGNPQAPKVFTEKVGERLTQDTRNYLTQASLPMLRRGAAMPYCEWGLNEEDGPGILMPHLSKARHLARMVAYGFQRLAEDGKANDGVDDLAAGFSFSRHVAADGIVISFLVHVAIDAILAERSAFFLPQLDKVHLKHLAEALDRLPPQSVTTADVIRNEKRIFGDWMRVHLIADIEKKGAGEALKALGVEMPALAAMTKEDVVAQLDEMGRFYDQMADLHKLPMSEFEKKAPELEASVLKAGPLTRMCLPVLTRVRTMEAGMQVRFRMYRAAIDVLLEGQGALARYPDPYDEKPFGYKATPAGFELTSNLKVNEKVVSLNVGGKLGVAAKPEAAPAQGDPPPKAPEF